MKRMVFGESVQGASHKRVDKECQDSFKKLEYDDGTVINSLICRHSFDIIRCSFKVFCQTALKPSQQTTGYLRRIKINIINIV